jgi:hypothetical protein
MAQIRERRKMMSEHERHLYSCLIKDSALANTSLLRSYIEGWNPRRMLQMERMDNDIGDV